MKKSAKNFRDAAWAQLKGNWKASVLMTLVYLLIVGIVGNINNIVLNILLSFLVLNPLGYGYHISFLKFKRTGTAVKIEELFDGFKDYKRIITTYFLTLLYTYLWMLLLIIPGIIKSFSYSQTSYILKDNPELKNDAAIELSMAMMKGHKMEYFCLMLSFIGWILLCIPTFGIGLLWLTPYVSTASANFYEYVKEDYEQRIAA